MIVRQRAQAQSGQGRGRYGYMIMAAMVLIVDRYTKYLIESNLELGVTREFLPPFIYLTKVHNYGVAFGLFSHQPFFILVASLICVASLLMLFKYQALQHKENSTHSRIMAYSLGLIFSGALSNMYDRVMYGYVVDVIDLRVWPVFNIADSAISIGTLLLFTLMFLKSSGPLQSS